MHVYYIVESEILKNTQWDIFHIFTWLFPICFWEWNFTIFCLGLYNKQNITRWLEDYYDFYLLVLKTIFYSLAALVRKILFSLGWGGFSVNREKPENQKKPGKNKEKSVFYWNRTKLIRVWCNWITFWHLHTKNKNCLKFDNVFKIP
jgi:hypothetical protein